MQEAPAPEQQPRVSWRSPRQSQTPDTYLRVDDCEQPVLEPLAHSLLVCGDASRALELLPDETVQTVLTSPPYWSLRDYEIQDQIGRDDDLTDYLASITEAFEKLKRVLRKDGTVWLNVGDAFTSGNRRYRAPDPKNRARAMGVRPPTPKGLKPKDLIGAALAARLHASRRRMVDSLRSDLAQTECSSRVRPRPPDQSARDHVSALEEPELLLRRERRLWPQWTQTAHRMGHPHRAQEEAQRTR